MTAYDQLRYLKNKDTITEEGLKASDLLKRIATDFRLNLGTVEDTGYTFETIVEENQPCLIWCKMPLMKPCAKPNNCSFFMTIAEA